MSEVRANIVVQPVQSTFAVTDNTVTFTPSDIQLNVYSGGRTGAMGFTGSRGPAGPPTGYTGSRGAAGPSGPAGGYTGSRGAQGIPGAVGNSGGLGYTGSAGYVGQDGYTGSIGFTGSTGYTGSASTEVGPQGPQGYTGSEGPQGPQGPQGEIGYTGSIGPQGPIGYTGSTPNFIANGTSNVSIPSTNGNITMNVAGTANVGVVSTVGANFTNLNLLKFGETVVNGGGVSGTITPNAAAGSIYKYTLNNNITLNTIANVVAGTSMTIMLTQDSTGGRLLTSSWKFSNGYYTLSTTPNITDIVFVFYDGTSYYAVLNRGFI